MSGLAKAFFYAGARTLMVSNWQVPSLATLRLTTQTVKNAANGHLGPAEAHRQAMLAMISSAKANFAHPSAWAAFQIVGADD
jgi:CHAT domain-containing protein